MKHWITDRVIQNHNYIYIYIGLVGRMFATSLGDLGSIAGCVIPKTFKMVLDTSLLNTQQHKVCIKGKWSNPGKGVVPSPTPQCSSYWKGSLPVALDYSRQLYLYIYIYLYICHYVQIHYNHAMNCNGKCTKSDI